MNAELPGTENGFRLRKANNADIPAIIVQAEKLNLDIEDISAESTYVTENNGQMAGFGRHKNYVDFTEISTVGVIENHRNKGAGKVIVKKLIITASCGEIWLTTVIPEYFERFGFKRSKHAPDELVAKTEKLCKKFRKLPENNVFMRLKAVSKS